MLSVALTVQNAMEIQDFIIPWKGRMLEVRGFPLKIYTESCLAPFETLTNSYCVR
jgi:hypothetical protein